MLSHTRMGVPYEYTHMGHPIRVWANIRIWGRTTRPNILTDDSTEQLPMNRPSAGWVGAVKALLFCAGSGSWGNCCRSFQRF